VAILIQNQQMPTFQEQHTLRTHSLFNNLLYLHIKKKPFPSDDITKNTVPTQFTFLRNWKNQTGCSVRLPDLNCKVEL
jgi:hypothetical protein